jgi:hypothetical protein
MIQWSEKREEQERVGQEKEKARSSSERQLCGHIQILDRAER